MSAEYSVEEVRAAARVLNERGVTPAGEIANAYADLLERIKADEGAVTDEVTERACKAMGRVKGFYPSWPEMRAALLEVWPNPPAHAVQVDQVGELLAIIHGDGGHYRAEHGLQKAAKDAQEKVIQMMTKIATAEPAAQGEVDELIDAYDDAVRRERESGFLPPLAQQAARDCVSHNRSRLRKALAAQPAQSVDVDMVREVILQLRAYQRLHEKWPDAFPDMELEGEADKLTAALQEKGNG